MLPLPALHARCFAVHFFQYADRALCTSIFLTSLGHTNLMSILVSSLNVNVCQCGHLIPRSRVSHITAPASPLPVSTSELLELAASTLLFVHDAIFLSRLLLPNTEWSWWIATPLLQGHVFPSIGTEKSHSFCLLLLPSVSSISTSPWEPSPHCVNSPGPCWQHTCP